MDAREQLHAIRTAPAHVIILDERSREVERHTGFSDLASAMVFSDALELPPGYTTVVGVQLLPALSS